METTYFVQCLVEAVSLRRGVQVVVIDVDRLTYWSH